jgi:multimeric flavodoxin WrbA
MQMTKKIVGLTCGKKNGNSEDFLKAALMGAEEFGIKSEIIRAMDLKVTPCTACWACRQTGKCAKDDVDWILEQTLLSDNDTAVIVAAPVYHLRSCSYLMIISEKTNHLFGRKADLFARRKVGAAISVGGSGYDGWTSLGLTSINLFLQHFTTLVDQIQINHCADKGAALTPDNDWAIERCKELGRNVAKAMNMPIEKVKYVGGDTPVSCPVCHCNIMYFEKEFPEIACPVCQVHGKVSVENGKYKIAWNADDIKSPRFSQEKEDHHREWLMRHAGEEHPQIAMPETQAKIKTYDAFGQFVKPEKKG